MRDTRFGIQDWHERGLPEDAALLTQESYDYGKDDYHSETWLDSKEIKQAMLMFWKGLYEDAIKNPAEHGIDPFTMSIKIAEFKNKNPNLEADYGIMYQHLRDKPSYTRDHVFKDFESISFSCLVNDMKFYFEEELKENPEYYITNVRLVIWFDN